MNHLVYKNARIILKNEVVLGTLSVVDGRISAIHAGNTAATNALDLEGDFLMPGMVEIHTDNFERHLMPRPKVQWAEVPALLAHDAEIAASGITTVLDALGVGEADTESVRGSTWNKVLSTLQVCTDQKLLKSDHYLHVRCELPAPNTVELFEPFINHPRLRLLSLMDHTPGQRQWEDINQARIYFTGKKGWTHEKFENKVLNAASLQEQYCEPNRKFFVAFCQEHGIHLASHDDTTIAHVEQAHSEGACISEFPTTLAAAQTAHANGMLNVMGGPNVVRGGSHSGNIAAAELGRAGLLDIISSDYVPGSLLSAVNRLVQDEILSLPQAVSLVTYKPSQATGLTDRGLIEPGFRADLLRMRMVELGDRGSHAVVRAVWREGQQII